MAKAARKASTSSRIGRISAAAFFIFAGCIALPAVGHGQSIGDLRAASLAVSARPLFLANDGSDGYGMRPWRADLARITSPRQEPAYRALLSSLVSDHLEVDVGVRAVSPVHPSHEPAYNDADVRIGYRLTKAIDLSVAGFSLLRNNRFDVIDTSAVAIPRSVLLTLRWRR